MPTGGVVKVAIPVLFSDFVNPVVDGEIWAVGALENLDDSTFVDRGRISVPFAALVKVSVNTRQPSVSLGQMVLVISKLVRSVGNEFGVAFVPLIIPVVIFVEFQSVLMLVG